MVSMTPGVGWNEKGEGRARARRAVDLDEAVVFGDEIGADEKPQTRALAHGLGGEKGSKMRLVMSGAMPSPLSVTRSTP